MENDNELAFLDVQVKQEEIRFLTSVYSRVSQTFFFKRPPLKKLIRFLPPPTRLPFKAPKTFFSFFFALLLQLKNI